MTGDAPFPPIDPNALGTGRCYFIDNLLVPYILPRLFLLTSGQMYEGDIEDIIGTQYAFQELLSRLTAGQSCMLGQVVMFFTQDPPVNSLLCDGTIYQRVDYLDLWSVLHADLKINAEQFRVPDMRDRSPKGWQASSGAVGALQGDDEIEIFEENVPQHTHDAIPHNHAITDVGHTHANNPHDHGVSDAGHSHNIAHSHNITTRTNASGFGSLGSPALPSGTGINSQVDTDSQSTNNSGTSSAGISIDGQAVNIQSSVTGISINNANASVGNWGGSEGDTIPLPIEPPVTLVRFAMIAR